VAAGQGNAFVAQADDASAIHYNPAGLSQVEGIQAVFGTALMGGSIAYNSPTGANVRGDFGGSVVFPPPSHTYLSANLRAFGWDRLSNVTVGLGLTSPYGLSTRYPVDGPFNSVVTSARMPLIDIKPTVAFKVNDDLAIGVSTDVYTFADFLGEGQVEQQRIGAGGATVELNGKGTGAGVTASLHYTALRNSDGKPVASIGLVYRSQAVLPLSGSVMVNGASVADASTSLVLPQVYTGGMAIWPVRTQEREWKLELDVEYVGWRSNRNLDLQLSNGTTIPQPQQWTTVPVVAIGTEYKWIHPEWLPHWDVAARVGYTRTENPVPGWTFNPGSISLVSNTISIGAGFLCTGQGRFLGLVPCGGESALWPKAIGLDVAYQEWIYEPFTVTGNQSPTVDGTYRAFVHLGTFSLKLQF
jgi:long-chain fatty acid transport protein